MSYEQEEPGITIDVSGPRDSGKTVICQVIHSALHKAGFTNIAMTDQLSEVQDPMEIRTVLDAVRDTRPDLFTTPIAITETTDIDTGDDVVNLSDVSIRVSDDDVLAVDELGLVDIRDAVLQDSEELSEFDG